MIAPKPSTRTIADARELDDSLHRESHPTLHTSASFAREIGSGSSSNAEDLSSFGYESTWGFFALPRSESYLSMTYLPSQSPTGGTEGAAGRRRFSTTRRLT